MALRGAYRNALSRSAAVTRADAHDLPELPPRKIDYVLIANTFHGVTDKTAMARAIAPRLSNVRRCNWCNEKWSGT